MAEKAEDLNLPLTVITRIIKESLPDGVIVSKEARTAISRAASVFILHATNYANQNALQCKRKTITSQDVIEGVKELDMDDFAEPLQAALEAWKATQKTKNSESKKKNAAKKSSEVAEEREEEREAEQNEESVFSKSPIILDNFDRSGSPQISQDDSGSGPAIDLTSIGKDMDGNKSGDEESSSSSSGESSSNAEEEAEEVDVGAEIRSFDMDRSE